MASFASLLGAYDGSAATSSVVEPPRPCTKSEEEARLTRFELSWRRSLFEGAASAARSAAEACDDSPRRSSSRRRRRRRKRRRSRSSSSSSSSSSDDEKKKKKKQQKKKREIAVCILCVDSIPHEAIWRRWAALLTEVDVAVRFYVHAHRRCSSEWVAARVIKAHFDTKWGSTDLVLAMDALMDAALVERPDYVLFASETCVPVATPADLARELYSGDQKSWLLASNCANNGFAAELQWDRCSPALPKECVWKADQWLLLTRRHAETLRRLPGAVRRAFASRSNSEARVEAWRLFARVRASDEMYFASMLALCGDLKPALERTRATDRGPEHAVLRPLANPGVACRRLTWCDWSCSAKSPRTYPALTRELVQRARAEGCLFVRKIAALDDALEAWEAATAPDDAAPP